MSRADERSLGPVSPEIGPSHGVVLRPGEVLSCAGHSGVPNQDAAGSRQSPGGVGRVSVLVDGAGVAHQSRAGCEHSVEWFAGALAEELLDYFAPTIAMGPVVGAPVTLPEALAVAIQRVVDRHPQCDAARGPWATVVIARSSAAGIDYLVLSDSSMLWRDAKGQTHQIMDGRIADPTYREVGMNTPGGHWVARQDPQAAQEALSGHVDASEVSRAWLASDGAMRSVELFGVMDLDAWEDAAAADTAALAARVRHDEARHEAALRERGEKPHDDLTIARAW